MAPLPVTSAISGPPALLPVRDTSLDVNPVTGSLNVTVKKMGETAVGSLWGKVTTFALASAEQFHAPPPPKLTSQAYTDAFNEVKNYGGDSPDTLRTALALECGV